MKKEVPILQGHFEYLNAFYVLMIIVGPLIVVDVNWVIIVSIILGYSFLGLKFLIYKVYCYEEHLEILKPFNKKSVRVEYENLAKVKYLTGLYKTPSGFRIKLKNNFFPLSINNNETVVTARLIKIFLSHSILVTMNHYAQSELKKYDIVSDKNGKILNEKEKENIVYVSNYG